MLPGENMYFLLLCMRFKMACVDLPMRSSRRVGSSGTHWSHWSLLLGSHQAFQLVPVPPCVQSYLSPSSTAAQICPTMPAGAPPRSQMVPLVLLHIRLLLRRLAGSRLWEVTVDFAAMFGLNCCCFTLICVFYPLLFIKSLVLLHRQQTLAAVSRLMMESSVVLGITVA